MDRSKISWRDLLLLAVGILLLTNVIVPGVQQARERARRMACAKNLQQISSGISQYAATHGCFPLGASTLGGFHSTILPYIGYSSLFESIPSMLGGKLYGDGPSKLKQVCIPVYCCPSDPAPHLIRGKNTAEATSYAGNSGTGILRDGFNGVFGYPHLKDLDGRIISAADITGGLSQTALIAEILHGDSSFRGQRLRVNWNTKRRYASETFDEFKRDCEQMPQSPAEHGWRGIELQRGIPWTTGNMAITMYNHCLPPNRPNCLNSAELTSAISSSGSTHTGGANMVACDGHVQFIAAAIDRRVWDHFGSRD